MRSEMKPSQDEEKNGQEPLLPPIQPVIDFGSVVIKNSRAAIHCLTIAGQIEGHMLLPNTQKATVLRSKMEGLCPDKFQFAVQH
mgnify:CR=1 FL=1